MSDSFVDTALRYRRAGLCILPAVLAEKRPALSEWKSFQQRLPDEARLKGWFGQVDAACIVAGEASGQLELLDFDAEGELYPAWSELVDEMLPGLRQRLVIETSQSGGRHAVYRCAGPVPGSHKLAERVIACADGNHVTYKGKKLVPRLVDGQWQIQPVLIETRGEGGLFLCHPSPGYDLLQHTLADVPLLTDEERNVLVEAARSLNEVLPKPERPVALNGSTARPGDEFNQRGNIEELLTHHGWKRVKGGDNQYWRRPGKQHGVSATLKDRVFYVFSSNAPPFEPDRAYAPFSVYALLEHAGDFEAAARQLGQAGYGDDGQATDVDLSRIMGAADESAPDPNLPADPGPFPMRLIEEAPDIVQRCFDYYWQNAFEAQPVLFLASLIAATGTVLGHKVRDASGLRTNIYTLGITQTGGGKEATREVILRIFRHAELESWCGPEDFASDAGLIAAVELQNPIMFQVDEFGRLMHCVNAGAKASPHLYNINGALLKLYSKAGSVYRAKAYADAKRNKQIAQPHVCIYGTTVAGNFWKSMDSDSLEGGFLPRLVILESKEDSLAGQAEETEPPREVCEFFANWAHRKVTPGNIEKAYPRPMVVPYAPEATELMDSFKTHQKAQQKQYGDLGVLWSRARELAGKLALIHACWSQYERPVVTPAAAQWAIDLMTHVVGHTLYEAYFCIADGVFHERCQKVLAVLRRDRAAGHQETTRTVLMRGTRNMAPRERDDAIRTLIEQKLIAARSSDTKGRRGTFYRLLN